MRIILCAIGPPLADAWQNHCGNLDFVTVHRGSIFDVHCEVLVSPANSFGFMDGGIDALYTRRFGWQVQEHLQELIRARHQGELLVGTAEVVDTNDPEFPFVIAAPTMRVPMILRDSVNPYLAARAALLLARDGTFPAGQFVGQRISEVVRTIAFPGMGTRVGGISPATCAKQVRAAIEEVVLGRNSFPTSWADAQTRHQLLYSERTRDLQRG